MHPERGRTRGDDIEIRVGESCVAEGLDDLPGSVVADIAVDQGDGTTTESTTGHPRTEDPGSAGCVNGGVQLGASDLVVVTQGVVGGVHERSDLADASGVDWSVRQVPFDLDAAGLVLLVIDTRASHRLVDGQYEARRRACESACRILGVASLREVGDLGAALSALDDEEVASRVRHVVTENDRVTQFAKLVDAGRIREVGPLMADISPTA